LQSSWHKSSEPAQLGHLAGYNTGFTDPSAVAVIASTAAKSSGGDVFDLQMVVPEKRDALGREVIDALGGDCSHHYANDMISRTAMVASSFTSVRLLRKSIAQVRQKNPTGAIHGFDPLRSPDRA
jgi:hypothetical protein